MVPREGVRPPRLGLEAQAPDSPDEAYWRSREESNLRIPPSQGRRQIRWREHGRWGPVWELRPPLLASKACFRPSGRGVLVRRRGIGPLLRG